MLIGRSDHAVLAAICHGYRGQGSRIGAGLRLLAERLRQATVVEDEELPDDVTALGSLLHLTELSSGLSFDCSIVPPGQADLPRRHVSVLSLIGASVVGERQGNSAVYRFEDRLRLIRIDRVFPPDRLAQDDESPNRSSARRARCIRGPGA